MGRFCKPFARKRDDDEMSVFHSLGLLCLDVDGQILQTFCDEEEMMMKQACFTHLVCYVWMWMGRFCKPFARKRDDDETSVFHSLGLLCLDVDGQILQTFCNENNYDDRSFCFLLLECIFDMFPFLC